MKARTLDFRQLSLELFPSPPKIENKGNGWKPTVGARATITTVIAYNIKLGRDHYCYGDHVVIDSIDGDKAHVTVKGRADFFKNGERFIVSVGDLSEMYFKFKEEP